MLIRIDERSSEPMYLQIAAQIRSAIATHQAGIGTALPAVRDLADSLGVNMHTVRAAYGVLRDEGLVDMRRGRSVQVVGRGEQAKVHELARQLVVEARRFGFSNGEIEQIVQEQM